MDIFGDLDHDIDSPLKGTGHIVRDRSLARLKEASWSATYSSAPRENAALDRIEDFQAFVAIVEKGSLTAAAKQLGRSLQSVSRSLAALEGDLGVELVARTTRRSAATEAGLAFYRRVGAALSEIEAAGLETANHSSEAAGLLRIASSTVFAPLYVVPRGLSVPEVASQGRCRARSVRQLCRSDRERLRSRHSAG